MGTLGFYTGRALQMSPGDAARLAARRAMRSARQWLYLYGRRVHPRELEAAPDLLGARTFAWCDPVRREGTVEALRQVPGAVERAKARAQRALDGAWLLFGREFRFGRGAKVPWSRDPVSGRSFPADGVDPKYAWQLGRLESAVALAQGYWLASGESERERHASAFVAQVEDFLLHNPPGVGIQWACAMEVSLRAANLAQSLQMFRGAPETSRPAFLELALRGLAEHVAFVEAHREDRVAVPNNHLIADDVGVLVVTTLFPGLPGAVGQRDRALAALGRQVERQVHEDGVSFEGSTSYHRLVAELCVLALQFGAGGEVSRRTWGSLGAAAAWCSERGLAPNIGDNDSGRALALTDRPSLEHGYLADLGAAMFRDPALKREGQAFPADEVLWLLGAEGLRAWRELDPGWSPRAFSSERGGFHVLRGAGAVVTLCAGPQGENGAGSHSHNDKLAFELHLDGAPVIVDPGSPTYGSDPVSRNAFRATGAHNTLEVNGEEQVPFDPARLFTLGEGTFARVEAFESTAELDRLEAVHDGYTRFSSPVQVGRVLELRKADRALRVEERLEGEGVRLLKMSLQFPDAQVRVCALRGRERLRALQLLPERSREGATAIEVGPEDAPTATILFEPGWDVKLEDREWSPGYGERRAGTRAVLQRMRELPARIRWVVLFGKGGMPCG